MVFVLHDKENKITTFSDSSPKDNNRYFEINCGDAGIVAYRASQPRGAHLLAYDNEHHVIGLRREMPVEDDKFIYVGGGLINLVLHATVNLEEAQKDAETLRKAQEMEAEGFAKDDEELIEEALSLERPILYKYQKYQNPK